jgi:hypothetical protein
MRCMTLVAAMLAGVGSVQAQMERDRGERLGTTPLGFRTPRPGAAFEPVEAELAPVRYILTAPKGGRHLPHYRR